MKANEVLKKLNITRPTLSSYVKKGLIQVSKLPNGQYDYQEDSIYKFLNRNLDRQNVIYTRVSTSNQKKDLENQKDTIYKFCKNNGIKIDNSYSDISSGMNYDRKEFNKLMEDVLSYKIDTIYISYKDRFGRIAFDTIEKLFNSYGTRIVSISDIGTQKDTEKEFIDELVSMIHSFSMKMYSNRRKKKLELISKDLALESNIKDF
jgi:putative resolvase